MVYYRLTVNVKLILTIVYMSILTPQKIVKYASEAALRKSEYSTSKVLVLSFLAGAYIAMGSLLAIIVGYGFPGFAAENPAVVKLLMGATFPVGLILVVIAGGELFTGNTAYFVPNVMSGRQGWSVMVRNWGLVWMGNFMGALFFAYFMVHLTNILSYDIWAEGVKSVATAKVSNPFYVTFLKGVGANWLVCLAMWLGMSSKSTTGKIFGIWWPVMTFVTIGYEHSIANMFFIPIAMFGGADISIMQLFGSNLLPATLGNIVGGAIFVGLLYWHVYDDRKKS